MFYRLPLYISLLIAALVLCGFAPSYSTWEKKAAGINESQINCIKVHPVDEEIIFVGTPRALYRSTDGGGFYQQVLALQGSKKGINSVYVDEDRPESLYAATDSGVFVSQNEGDSFQKIFEPQDADSRQCLSVLANDQYVFVGTFHGLFKRPLQSSSWLKARGDLGNKIIFRIQEDEDNVYIATYAHLYREDKKTQEMNKVFRTSQEEYNGVLENENYTDTIKEKRKIKDIAITNAGIYLATENGIFFSNDKAEHWKKVQNDGLPTEDITSIAVLSSAGNSGNSLTARRSFLDQKGNTEEGLSRDTLPPQRVNQPGSLKKEAGLSHGIRASGQDDFDHWNGGPDLLVGTRKGIFVKSQGHKDTKSQEQGWQALYKGMETNDIHCVEGSDTGQIYVGTDRGVFAMQQSKGFVNGKGNRTWDIEHGTSNCTSNMEHRTSSDGRNSIFDVRGSHYEALMNNFSNEPTINEIQQLAIDYAEVNEEKIKDWRARANKKAWLPSMSIGLDIDKNKTISDSVWGSYSSGGQHYIGPDDKTFYNNLAWDISMSWDFSELIWNNDQTSIDSRSKMMVELREDILDQVTRLYFERRRLQVELLTEQMVEQRMLIDKNMRVEELTALIDALTGGKFSEMMKNGT